MFRITKRFLERWLVEILVYESIDLVKNDVSMAQFVFHKQKTENTQLFSAVCTLVDYIKDDEMSKILQRIPFASGWWFHFIFEYFDVVFMFF